MSFLQRPKINNIYENFIDREVINNTINYVEKLDSKIFQPTYKSQCLTTNAVTSNILNINNLQALYLNILSHLHNYMILSNSFYQGFISHSWINIYLKEYNQEFHSHLDSIYRHICGIVYLSDSDAVTEFYLHDRIAVKPEVGKIIIFPDSVEHRVAPNDSEQKRTTLAFNYRKCQQWQILN